MKIRVATDSDIPEMGRVRMSVRENRIASLSSLRPGDTERMLNGDGCGWVCEVAGRIVAFAIADLSGANVYALFVEPGHEGQGIGRRLHDTMMDWFFAAVCRVSGSAPIRTPARIASTDKQDGCRLEARRTARFDSKCHASDG